MLDTIKEAFKDINKKTLIYLGGGIAGIILLIVVISFLARISVKSYKSYEEVESLLVTAAEKYYNDYPEYLPLTEKSTSVVNITSLVNKGYIDSLENLLGKNSNCTAQVVATKLSSGYDYTPYLDCGDDYSSEELYKRILEDNSVVEEGKGLYKIDSEYVFKGEVKNNYILLNGKLWRIMRIDDNNNAVIISEEKTDVYTWDDRYNLENQSNDGINNYNVSRIKESLEDLYYNGKILTDSEKSKVVSDYWCVGVRTAEQTDNMKNVECATMSDEISPIGLITPYEYINASIDENCNIIFDKSCINYNYLSDYTGSYWTITPGTKNTSYVYVISTSGVSQSRASSSKKIRYIIKLSTKATYNSGSGTMDDPYAIK